MDSERKRLLDFFELEDNATLKDLKKRFKELLLIYHPDVNKDGHTKTQEIIENYNKLFDLIR
jgi:DnaJ-class molecular chaperone